MAKIIKDLGKHKKKKTRKGSAGKSFKSEVNSTKDYNEEDEGMDTKDETVVKEESTSKVQAHKKVESSTKRRRGIESEANQDPSKGLETNLVT